MNSRINNIVIRLFLAIIVISLAIAANDFAYADEIQNQYQDSIIELNEDNDDTIYYFVDNGNGEITITNGNQIKSGILDPVGSLTVTGWSGNNVAMTIKVTSDTAMLRHTGTIHFLSVTSVGTVGSEFNSMTFSTSSPIGVHTLYKQVTMNACGKTKIYIKLTDLKVYDTYGNVISMYNFGPKKYKKSNYQ